MRSVILTTVVVLLLIRVNKDEHPDISRQYDFDGKYIPRTFALSTDGDIITHLYPEKEKYWYFLPANNRQYLLDFAQRVSNYNRVDGYQPHSTDEQ